MFQYLVLKEYEEIEEVIKREECQAGGQLGVFSASLQASMHLPKLLQIYGDTRRLDFGW